MKIALSIPSVSELEAAYFKLLHVSPSPPTLNELALYCNWSRLDPRLGEIWVNYLSKHWSEIDCLALRREIEKTPWPGTAGVLLEFVEKIINQEKKHKKSRRLFRFWKGLLTESLSQGRGELYFIGLRQIGGEQMALEAEKPAEEYRKWGYLSRANFISKKSSVTYSPLTKRQILQDLAEKTKYVSVLDYWNAIDRCVSRRQAERDVQKCGFLRASGRTKGARWRK